MVRGWRRCGTYYYKFDLERSCCQPYVIRLDSTKFEISKSQRKVLKTFNKFLLGEIDENGKKMEAPAEQKKEPKPDLRQHEATLVEFAAKVLGLEPLEPAFLKSV